MKDLVLLLLSALSVAGAPAQPASTTSQPEAEIPPATHTEPPPATGGGGSGSLLVVGDSLAVGSQAHVEAALPGWNVQHLARTSKPTSDGVAEITSRGNLPGVIAVSLGTNDDPSATGTFQGHVETVIDAAGPSRCVIWVNIVRPPYNGVSYSGYNRVLANAAATVPNFFVVDWRAMVAGNPGFLAGDGVHATPSGYAARGRAIAEAARSCGGGPRGQPTPGLPSD